MKTASWTTISNSSKTRKKYAKTALERFAANGESLILHFFYGTKTYYASDRLALFNQQGLSKCEELLWIEKAINQDKAQEQNRHED